MVRLVMVDKSLLFLDSKISSKRQKREMQKLKRL